MIRFAILAGVSTDPQAREDKLSIPDQLAHCRQTIQKHGAETAGPYIMDGYSRTGYDSLDVAMLEIPPLGEAIRAAHADLYDILIMDNFDRLGDLGILVGTRFRKLRKQLHSARQSGLITDPQFYDPYASESADIDMFVQGIIQRYRINKIRRGWNIGVPARARAGLHPLSLPFGYQIAGKDQPAVQVPEQVQLIRQMVEMFLSGTPLQTIADFADRSDIKPPRSDRWHRHVIHRIIVNPYYAGITQFGRLKTVQGKRLPVPPSQWITAPGRHQPIHDETTWQAILAEDERRRGLRTRSQTYALSGLLSCSICGARLHRHGKLDSPYPVDLSCPQGHINIYYGIALKIVARELIQALSHVQPPEPPENASERFQIALAAQQALRRQIQSDREAGIYTQDEAHRRVVAIETEIDRLTRQRDRAVQLHQRQQALLQYSRQDLSRLHDWLLHGPPSEVNHLLTALCETITLTPRYELEILWR